MNIREVIESLTEWRDAMKGDLHPIVLTLNAAITELENAAKSTASIENAKLRLTVEILRQDLSTTRRIIEKGGSAADVLAFLDTPTA